MALLIDDLFNQFHEDNDVITIAKNSLQRKKQQTEKETVSGNDKVQILNAIVAFARQLKDKTPESSNNKAKLEGILTEYNIHLKSKYYGG